MREGFSLIEVVVALLVLEVGMLATSALALQALRTQRAAADLERARWAASLVLDSLSSDAPPGPGSMAVGDLVLRWGPPTNGAVVLDVVLPEGDVALTLRVPTGSRR